MSTRRMDFAAGVLLVHEGSQGVTLEAPRPLPLQLAEINDLIDFLFGQRERLLEERPTKRGYEEKGIGHA